MHCGLQQKLGTPQSVLEELRGAPNLSRPTEDAATAEEAVAAPPPPSRPNCRGDASSRLRARPNRPASRGQARRPEVAAPGLPPTTTARRRPGPVTPRAATGQDAPPSAEATNGSGRPRT
ncbi:uncharacterized protein LOC143435357 [Arvicanthis niloticus]|uniref:uncharacterized protein LOC143309686 n=1 Tax=Arvicanthis niloticus TaxID=61156 RepID=UPI00402B505A